MNCTTRRKPASLYVGINIGKNRLDVACVGRVFSVSNNLDGWKKLLSKIRKQSRYLHFVCEPTGWIGEGLSQFLHQRRKKVSLIPPFRARQFAEATGRLAKNDRIDALMLADLGEKLKPRPSQQLRKAERDLQAAMRCRRFLLRTQKDLQRKLKTMDRSETHRSFASVIERVVESLESLTNSQTL